MTTLERPGLGAEDLSTGHRPTALIGRTVRSAMNKLLRRPDGQAQELGAESVAAVAEVSYDFDLNETQTDEVSTDSIEASMRGITERYMQDVEANQFSKPENTQVGIQIAEISGADDRRDVAAEQASRVHEYSTTDPWQEANPGLVSATERLIAGTIGQVEKVESNLDLLREEGNGKNLTYINAKRASSANGKKRTIITEALRQPDSVMRSWIDLLPNAEGLYTVADPERGIPVYDDEQDSVEEVPSSLPLRALTTGARNGRAVREREAWAEQLIKDHVNPEDLEGNVLRLTDLGTGTGDPGMRAGISILPQLGPEGRVEVTGFDINPRSLAVAGHMANKFADELEPGSFSFEGRKTNFLTREGVQEAVADTDPNVLQSIGFTEYVPSDNSSDPMEQKQRDTMERLGFLSAEEFHSSVYEAMPSGSMWLTGNMQPNTEGKFVTEGLGWGNIIMRSLSNYMKILKDADIPRDSVRLYVPNPNDSAGVYNLVAITKP